MRVFFASLLVLTACSDPCSNYGGDPSIELAGGDVNGAGYEAFEPGAQRPLVFGSQGGMHVWMQARIRNMCPDTTRLERRIVDDATDSAITFNGAPAEFVSGPDDSWQLSSATAIILCPPVVSAPIVGQRLRLVTIATDEERRTARAEIAFVPFCPERTDCTQVCMRR